jgi:hypothetical protein
MPSTTRKNQSALVAILQARIDAEKVSVWNPSESSVQRALWVDNTSALTLDEGSFNALEGEAFAGEGDGSYQACEKRLLSVPPTSVFLSKANRKRRTSASPE